VNQPRPLGKAKYSCVTDSETVPRGKGEKNPGEGSETEHETVSLQAVGGRFKRLTACLLKNEPATYRSWQVKVRATEAKAKASLNRASEVTICRPEPG
jgi:hypothetical protein